MQAPTVYGETGAETVVVTQSSEPSGGGGLPLAVPGVSQAEISWDDEGVEIAAPGVVNEVDFVGAGVTASRLSGKVTVTIPGIAAGGQVAMTIKDEAAALAAAGVVDQINFTGAGVTAALVGTQVNVTVPGASSAVSAGAIPDLTVTQLSPVNAGGDTQFDYPTIPAGWNVGPGTLYLRFEFQTTNYFANNPGGHIAVVLREYDPAWPKGSGIAMGNLTGADIPRGSRVIPCVQVEDFNGGTAPVGKHWMIPGSDISPSYQMLDATRYLFEVWSKTTPQGTHHTRYRMCKRDANGFDWNLEKDTGDVRVDPGNTLDHTGLNITFAEVFRTVGPAWTIAYSNIYWTWGPCESAGPDVTCYLNRKGGDVEGNIRITGAARKFEFTTTGAATDYTLFTSNAANGDCNVYVAPSGANTHAGIVLLNKYTPAGAFNVSSFQTYLNRARIQTLTYGGAALPPLDIDIGGTIVATFAQNGITVKGASERIGQNSNRLYGLYNYGSADALTLTQGAQDMGNWCAPGWIQAAMGGGGTMINAAMLETVVRPAYGMISNIYADLIYRKILLA